MYPLYLWDRDLNKFLIAMQESSRVCTEPCSLLNSQSTLLSPKHFGTEKRRYSTSNICDGELLSNSSLVSNSIDLAEISVISTVLPFAVSRSSSFNSKSPNSPYRCRICLDSSNWEDMISPCNCKGSMKYIHSECLKI